MILEVIDRQEVGCAGGFIAEYADPIVAHVNPGHLQKRNIAILVKGDGTIWGKRITQEDTDQNDDNWVEIEKDAIKPQKSPILKDVCFFNIKKGSLYGTYIVSEDFIKNEQFSNEQSYLQFITN